MTNALRTFNDGVAIITGAASGIGKALAELLAARGCQVVLADIDGDDVEIVAKQIRDRGGRGSARTIDVTDPTAVHGLVSETFTNFGRLDYLFNNAGIGVSGEVADYTIDSWRRIIDVNILGVVHGIHAAYPVMSAQGFGHIINTASMAGLTTCPGLTSYAATKHAVVGLSRAMRVEAAARGVRVSVLCPGVIDTPIIEGGKHGIFLLPMPEAQQRALARRLFKQFRPMEVTKFARKVLDQVARNRAIIVVPRWYRLLWWVERLSPTVGFWLARKAFEHQQQLVKAAGSSS